MDKINYHQQLKELSNKTFLITGSAGFIGFSLAKELLTAGCEIVGIDNFNDYYEVSLKEERNRILEKYPNYKVYRGDISDCDFIKDVLNKHAFDKVINLAAQAGVRPSLINPYPYFQSNVLGFLNLINESKNRGIKDFIYASSSSVYGNQTKLPFSDFSNSFQPDSFYGVTKLIDESIANYYHKIYGLSCTGLRFFTVYGPYGRPDMAYYLFTSNLFKNEKFKVFGNGLMKRDFTYIDDIIAGIVSAIYYSYPFEVFNLGNDNPVEIKTLIDVLEKETGHKAKPIFLPVQSGDMLITHANIESAKVKLGYKPIVKIEEGLKNFIDWYKKYNKVN